MYPQGSNFEKTHQIIRSEQLVPPQHSLLLVSIRHVFAILKLYFSVIFVPSHNIS